MIVARVAADMGKGPVLKVGLGRKGAGVVVHQAGKQRKQGLGEQSVLESDQLWLGWVQGHGAGSVALPSAPQTRCRSWTAPPPGSSRINQW